MKQDLRLVCDECRIEERFILHNIRYHASYRRFCTNCVLKNYQGLFCPICFDVYREFPPACERAMCLKCPSISHVKCAGKKGYPSFLCPFCKNPNFKLFDRKSCGGNDSDEEWGIDVESAKVLVAAAEIASMSMNKAAEMARRDAEKRVREAGLARKGAVEAFEEFRKLMLKERGRERKYEGC